MPKLTAAQIAGIVKYSSTGAGSSFAQAVGNMDTNGPIWVAIALAESSGETDVVGGPNSNGTHDYGLWQINEIHKDLLSRYDWKNPNDNYAMATQIYIGAGNRFTPWSTYNNGAYATHMAEATLAWGHPDMSKADKNAITDAANAAGQVIQGNIWGALGTLFQSSTWVRVGEAIAGLMLIIIALWPMIKSQGGAALADSFKVAKVAAVA